MRFCSKAGAPGSAGVDSMALTRARHASPSSSPAGAGACVATAAGCAEGTGPVSALELPHPAAIAASARRSEARDRTEEKDAIERWKVCSARARHSHCEEGAPNEPLAVGRSPGHSKLPVKARRLRPFFFFLFVTYGAFLPFFPTWLEARGVRGLSMSALMALGPAMGIVGPPGFGALSDWLGLRAGLLRLVTAAGLVSMLMLAVPSALGTSPGFPLLFVAMLLFSTSRAPAVAIADVMAVEAAKEPRPDGKAESYGSIRLWGSIGFLVATLAVGRGLDIRAATELPAVLAAASLVTFALAFRLDAAAPPRAHRLGAQMGEVLRDRGFLLLLVAGFLGFGAHASYDICFSLRLVHLGFGSDKVGVAWAIGTLAEVGLMAVSGRLLARAPASALLVIAYATGAARWVLIALVEDVRVLLAFQPLHAVTFALFWVTSIDQVKARAPKEVLATAQGVFNAAVGGGAVVGMFVWGGMFEAYGGRTTFLCAAGVAACAALAAAGIGRPARAPEA